MNIEIPSLVLKKGRYKADIPCLNFGQAESFLKKHQARILQIFQHLQWIELYIKIIIIGKISLNSRDLTKNFEKYNKKNFGYAIQDFKKYFPKAKINNDLSILRLQRNSFMHILTIVAMLKSKKKKSPTGGELLLDAIYKTINRVYDNIS